MNYFIFIFINDIGKHSYFTFKLTWIWERDSSWILIEYWLEYRGFPEASYFLSNSGTLFLLSVLVVVNIFWALGYSE